MSLELITDATIEPLVYQNVLDHMRINPFDEEIDEASIEYIDTLIRAVRDDVETFTGRALLTQTWKYYLDGWPSENYIEIPKPPLQSASVVVLTKEEVSETIAPTSYLVDTVSTMGGKCGRIILASDQSWPSFELYPMNPIQIEFVCGYGVLAEDVPKRIIQAILIQVADLYQNRETVIIGQTTNLTKLDIVEKLLWPLRVKVI